MKLAELLMLDEAQQAREAAAASQRNSVRSHFGRQQGAATQFMEDMVIPKTPLDAGLMVAGGPVGKGAKALAVMLGAALQPSDAEAGPLAKLLGGSTAPKGIKAYHGSPHDFDRFDLSRIGTGEGAQAYGHGLYFAENPATAQVYRDQVKNMALIDANNRRMSDLVKEMDKYKSPGGGYRQFNDPRGHELAKEYDRLMEEKFKPGKMYEVNINAHPDQFLDWDKRMLDQSKPVQDVLQREWLAHPDLNQTGQDIYRATAKNAVRREDLRSGFDAFTPYGATEKLREAGIPGIKYLDQGSRGLAGNLGNRQRNLDLAQQLVDEANRVGDPRLLADAQSKLARATNEMNKTESSNYVLFDDSIIDILRKYGLAPGAAIPAAGAMQSQDGQPSALAQLLASE